MYKRKIVGDQNIDVVQSKTQCIIGTPKVRITFSRAKKKKPSMLEYTFLSNSLSLQYTQILQRET